MYIEFEDGSKLAILDEHISAFSINGNRTVLTISTINSAYTIESHDVNNETWGLFN